MYTLLGMQTFYSYILNQVQYILELSTRDLNYIVSFPRFCLDSPIWDAHNKLKLVTLTSFKSSLLTYLKEAA